MAVRPRLIFLYGPPAVGKLTIARAIAQREPFKIVHNHLTIDPVAQVLPFGSEAFWEVVGRFRHDLVSAAAEEGIDTIYTYVFAPDDAQHVADIVAAYEAHDGVVAFVQLRASREVLLQRVTREDRRQHGKLTDPETLARLLDEYDGFTALAHPDSQRIDLDATSAADAADEILERFQPPYP
jgi:chloramphenicol 3-O-phosphotransferase